MLIDTGVKKAIYGGDYPDDLAKKILQDGKIKVEIYKKDNIS